MILNPLPSDPPVFMFNSFLNNKVKKSLKNNEVKGKVKRNTRELQKVHDLSWQKLNLSPNS